ncbi:aspartyl-phosphate phosphatase Spo0E family protein [Pseudogracilibacillus auburnensis]|nr:aspartyl-phosphate phosphatase Spo0E family protein [Pseudogracilibacillus auburnensis]
MTLKKIEDLRHQLAKTVYAKGYTNIKTIEVSQELDGLINIYNSLKRKKN